MSVTWVESALALGYFACEDDANDIAMIALRNGRRSKDEPGTVPQHQKTRFVARVFGIKELNRELVKKDGLGLFKTLY